jgi:hypothetical protein
VKYLADGESFTTAFSICTLGLNFSPLGTALLLNDGLSVPKSPNSTMSPLATISRAISVE